MASYRLLWLILVMALVFPEIGEAQISQGGEPMKTSKLKSSLKAVIEMPPLKSVMTGDYGPENLSTGNKLKPFRFAYPFEVNFTPENSGEWLQGENGYTVWKITIRSAVAKSLNIIFDEFNLSEAARLFLYNEKRLAWLSNRIIFYG